MRLLTLQQILRYIVRIVEMNLYILTVNFVSITPLIMDDIVKITNLLELFKAEGYNVSTEEMATAIIYEIKPFYIEERTSYSEIISKVDLPDQEYQGSDLRAEDQARLNTQQELVENLMKDGNWRTLTQIHLALPDIPECSVSAHLRYADNSGRFKKEKQRVNNYWTYRLIKCIQ